MNKEDIRKKVNAQIQAKEIEIKERKVRELEAWDRLNPFLEVWDVPQIPVVPKEEFMEFYVPRLIAAGAIPKKDLVDQQVYIGNHRRCTIARWNATENHFDYWRNKFGCIFLDNCNHFEDDNGYALFVPIKLGTDKDFEEPKDCLRKI
jgi:hypothetical protein